VSVLVHLADGRVVRVGVVVGDTVVLVSVGVLDVLVVVGRVFVGVRVAAVAVLVRVDLAHDLCLCLFVGDVWTTRDSKCATRIWKAFPHCLQQFPAAMTVQYGQLLRLLDVDARAAALEASSIVGARQPDRTVRRG
jgi:hypothetical protein